jgi:hypothetical protein
MLRLRRVAIAATLAMLLSGGASAAEPLPAFQVDRSQTSVSGLSSGAFMAVQFHTAYSADIMGAGVVAGGPYNCAYVNWGGIETCLHGMPAGDASSLAAQSFAALGEIDSLDHLRRSRVYLFSGTKDTVVAQSVVDATYGYYQAVGVPESHIRYVKGVPAGHAFITPSWGATAARTPAPTSTTAPSGGHPTIKPAPS